MKRITTTIAVALWLVIAGTSALAQEATPDSGARPSWGRGVTPGWSMMSQHERNEHRDKMRSMKSRDECMAYQHEHHEQMMARAKERGMKPPAQPRRDACMGMGMGMKR